MLCYSCALGQRIGIGMVYVATQYSAETEVMLP
jgi:hypothetical protein